MGKAIKWLVKHEWLALIWAGVIFLRIPNLFEPYWYGDEAIYLVIGQAINKGVSLYSQIHDNKPPLLYLTAAISGGYLFWFKFLAMVWNLATIWVFTKTAEKFFHPNKRMVITATVIFALLTTLPLLEGNIANAELFFLLPSLAAVWKLWGSRNEKDAFSGGLLLGVGALFKMPVLLEAGVWPLLWLAYHERKMWKKTAALAAGAMIPILLSLVFYYFQGSGKEYLTAAWLQNLPYLSSWKAGSGGTGIYSIKARLLILAGALAAITVGARRIEKKGAILATWAALTLFAALLSGRPYPHYLLQMAGALAVATAWAVWGKEKTRLPALGVLAAGLLFFAIFRFYVYPVGSYYINFAQWIAGRKNTADYYHAFNPAINRNYAVAKAVVERSRNKDKIFVWGDEPMIYALARRLPSGRYTVKYHIKDFEAEEETIKTLWIDQPKYIISLGHEDELPGLSTLLNTLYRLEQTIQEARIYRLSYN
ncbi:hypothetical protein A2701_00305 [Candidatus Amesbacteria bacterium RIFCSPHIGHO2_01_FULL_47_34]|uniref:Glycosyltransferase RgtA/B/C/D-like domain-containing protein n=1 Tax=Candidatus Amesbacteria bacterium RIFCSPLOWO2_01_FULL_47_33 TaxID=1797258 RepID=A0A1F4Z4A3_9BACT|nr:MAG: hypothetical protein A2701_00305 [Candidatus Amesbacteria bacterium RIFCSPHIGHO2_01_FULL_47_34]OGD01149.1 MAG: hypothetical protein A2972_02875 [Candidatus Amesbacteria bacterium RIFCSPLOWO2_01_FULL_47_33]